ncbi:hypothetical protein [Caenispirillum bisanense]|uniref:Uncharacterized protein n=1 Tax=Caenispirillum bisanense TaxID=414052 RepID=A0A286H1X9_9PROT|nr:hypothetical protein [Caenispirillum bisanense]SOE01785.1 hypothetical protein SAMN05421508_1253 [Caenispirillum bisanense]
MVSKRPFLAFEESIGRILDLIDEGITVERPETVEAARQLANVGGALSFFFGASMVWHGGEGQTTEYSEQDRERRRALYSRAAAALAMAPTEDLKIALGDDLRGFQKARDYVLGVHLRFLKDHYAETASPTFAWQAYLCCRAAQRPVEDWVLEYLDVCAKRLVALTRDPPKDIPKEVAKAVGFGTGRGRGSPLTEAQRLEQDIEIYKRVRARLDMGDKRKIAWESVADDMGLSPSKVRETHKTFAEKFGDGVFPEQV